MSGVVNTGMGDHLWAANKPYNPDLLSLAIPLWVGTVSTSESCGENELAM